MAVNLDKPQQWKVDIAKSVDMYNAWFLAFAPKAYRDTRVKTTIDVEDTLHKTIDLTKISVDVLRAEPGILSALRMATCPPLAVDRLIGLSGVQPNLVKSMEEGRIPPRMAREELSSQLLCIAQMIQQLADPDIFVWIGRSTPATSEERYRAATIVADRLCGAVANPIIRNAQEKRQLAAIETWLRQRGYKNVTGTHGLTATNMAPGSFAFRLNVPVNQSGSGNAVNIPIDAVIMPKNANVKTLPLLVEAKSAGDFTNVNKRRKEEATKVVQLRHTYGDQVDFILFLCGYFDTGYLGYGAGEGIDWVWEHRIDDLVAFGL